MKKLRSLSVKSLAVFLSVLMVLLSFPLSVLAQDAVADNTQESIPSETLFEVVEQRTETTKTFHLEDGSYYLAQYDTAVHYLDENATWQEIDNTLSTSGSEITTSNAKIKFAKKTGGNSELFTLHDGNRKVTLSLDGARKKVAGKITNFEAEDKESLTKLQKMTTLENISASVLYEDILDGVDVEYVIKGANVKENIIVKEAKDAYSYSFTLSLNNLSAALNEDGEIVLSDIENGAAVYRIPAPVMWDAASVYSDAVGMQLTDLGNGKYTLTVTADAAWINAEERVFPVTIDPPLYTDSSSVASDYYTNGTTNYAGATLLVNNTYTAYWEMDDMPTLPASAYITKAEIELFSSATATTKGSIGVYDALLSSNNYTDYHTLDVRSDDYAIGNGEWRFNITPIVKEGYATRGGLLSLRFAPVSGSTFTGTARYSSNEAASADLKPTLCITYRDMKGAEDYWTYTSQSAGFAGSGSVNHANGNLIFSIPTLTSTDALMPFTPSLVYNSSLWNKPYTYGNAQTAYTTASMPYGFKLNIQETLIEKKILGIAGERSVFILADSDGTEHYFMPTASDANVYEDEDGLLLKLEKATSTCSITDSGNNIRTYKSVTAPSNTDSAWVLQSITDKNNNKVVFVLDSNNRPTEVQLVPNGLAAITQLKLAYNSSGRLCVVWNPTSGEGVVLRYSGNFLASITRAHGATAQSTWSTFYTSGSATGITNDATATYTCNSQYSFTVNNQLSKYRLTYSLSSNRVNSVAEYGNGSLGQEIAFTYGTNSTVVRSSGPDDVLEDVDMIAESDDLLTTYGFDGQGRTISCYTTDGGRTTLYGASNGTYVAESADNNKVRNRIETSVQTTEQSSNYLRNGGFEDGWNGWSKTGNVTNPTEQTKVSSMGRSHVDLSVDSTNTTATLSQNVTLEPGDYNLSFYYNTFQNAGVSVTVTVESLARYTPYSVTLDLPIDENNATNDYIFQSLNFTAEGAWDEPNPEQFRVKVTVSHASGNTQTVSFDNFMLSRTTGAAEFDMLQGGHFESTGTAPSTYWGIENSTQSITVVDSGIDTFGKVVKIDGSFGNNKHVSQKIYEASDQMRTAFASGSATLENPARTFTVSGFAKGTAQVYGPASPFAMMVGLEYYKTNGTLSRDYKYYNFDKGITDWQFISGAFTTDPSVGLLNKITVTLIYDDHPGVAYFDNISVIEGGNSTNYTYNPANGLIQKHIPAKGSATHYVYNEDNEIEREIHESGTVIDYEYGAENPHRLEKTSVKTFGGTYEVFDDYFEEALVLESYTEYIYDNYGLCINSRSTDVQNPVRYLQSRATYQTTAGSHIFGVTLTEIDSLNQKTQYFYHQQNGRLLATLYPKGNGVTYLYDEIGNLINVMPAEASASSYTTVTGSAQVQYTYDATNRLSMIGTDSTVYTFTYDGFGSTTAISAGNNQLASYEYNAYNGKLKQLNYGNGLKVKYLYDEVDRISEICYNTGESGAFETVYTYRYNSGGELHSITDHVNDETTVYKYDTAGKLIHSYIYDEQDDVNLLGTYIQYDGQSRVMSLSHQFDYTESGTVANGRLIYGYEYQTDGNLKTMVLKDADNEDNVVFNLTVTPAYDNYGRTTSVQSVAKINGVNAFQSDYSYDYKTYSAYESGLVAQLVSTVGKTGYLSTTTTYNYAYDANGNITSVADGNGVVQYYYHYDNLGQLVRYDDIAAQVSYVYTYDNAGNLLQKNSYEYASADTLGRRIQLQTFSYSTSTWGDLLISTPDGVITYDAIGNPTHICHNLEGGEEIPESGAFLSWQGRELTKYEKIANYAIVGTYTYTYNADGIRTSKTINGVKHEYLLSGSQIVSETWTENGVTHTLIYVYDEKGSPIGLQYRTGAYAAGIFDYFFFEKNLQGDIVAIFNETGDKIGTYSYDAWGVCTTTNLSNGSTDQAIVNIYNPFRYRGYYYDVETGYYYLQSRYYNPNWCRFINVDSQLGVGLTLKGCNLYVYCNNNPVILIDPTGEWPDWGTIADVAVNAFAAMAGASVGAGEFVVSVFETKGDVKESFDRGVAKGKNVYGGINNTVNAVYYRHYADENSPLEDPATASQSAYVERGYINRWERLDHTKAQTKESYYSATAWNYYAEYSAHMYGWLTLGWADQKGYGFLSDWAERCKLAEIIIGQEDSRDIVRKISRIIGGLGI